jgi:hypothetical protein
LKNMTFGKKFSKTFFTIQALTYRVKDYNK